LDDIVASDEEKAINITTHAQTYGTGETRLGGSPCKLAGKSGGDGTRIM